MPFIETKHTEKGEKTKLYFEDYGDGQPIILIHGWPLSHMTWERQISALVDAGYRCIAYDRRGFGQSSKPWSAYDYSSLASDLNDLIVELNLHDVVLCGFSMGGGEVVRYFTDFGSKKISKAILISSIIPVVAKKADNPDGVPEKDLNGIMESLQTDYPGFAKEFGKNYFNPSQNKETVSQGMLDFTWGLAMQASKHATIETAKVWAGTDFRSELVNVDVPTLIVHGKSDNIVPIKTSADQAAKGIRNNRYEKFDDAPHGLYVTHTDKLNKILIEFLKG